MSKCQTWGKGVFHILWCKNPVYICTCRPGHLHHQKQVGVIDKTTQQNTHVQVTSLHSWSSALKHFFPFQRQIFPQVHGSAIGCPISTIVANLFIEELKSRPSILAPTLQRNGSGMLMKHFSPKRQNTTINSYNTSTLSIFTYSSLQRLILKMDPYSFLTLLLHLDLTMHYSQQYTGNLPTVPSLGQPPQPKWKF